MLDERIGNHGERTVAGANDWGYYANLSIYRFFSGFVRGKSVLEIGSGTGYGANYLAGVARSILSVDVDEPAISFCIAHASSKRIDFRLHDLSVRPIGDAVFEAIVTSNVLEHIPEIDNLLAHAAGQLDQDGVFLIAVPPVTSPTLFAENFRNVFHINNLTPLNWHAKFLRYFEEVQCFRHWVVSEFEGSDGALVGMGLAADETVIREHNFYFEELAIESLSSSEHCITAVFAVRRPRVQFADPSLEEELPRAWNVQMVCSAVMQQEVQKMALVAQYYREEFDRVQSYCDLQHQKILDLSAELHMANERRASLSGR